MAQTECLVFNAPGQTTASIDGHAVDVPNNHTVGFHWGVTPGGPYPNSIADGFFGNGPLTTISWNHLLTGLTCNTTYYFVAEEYDVDGITIVDSSTECNFTTTACPILGTITMVCDNDYVLFDSVHVFADVNNVPVGKIFKLRYGYKPGVYNVTIVIPTAATGGPQRIEETFFGLPFGVTFYNVFEVYDTDGVTLLATSQECSFTRKKAC